MPTRAAAGNPRQRAAGGQVTPATPAPRRRRVPLVFSVGGPSAAHSFVSCSPGEAPAAEGARAGGPAWRPAGVKGWGSRCLKLPEATGSGATRGRCSSFSRPAGERFSPGPVGGR